MSFLSDYFIHSDERLMLKILASLSLHGGNLTLINLFITNFSVSLPYQRGTKVSLETNLSIIENNHCLLPYDPSSLQNGLIITTKLKTNNITELIASYFSFKSFSVPSGMVATVGVFYCINNKLL